jgi:hypothetical protein
MTISDNDPLRGAPSGNDPFKEQRPETGSTTGGSSGGRDSLADRARREAADLGAAAKSRIGDMAEDQRNAGADTVSGIASAARTAADDLERTSPEFARYTREAAGAVDRFSDAIRRRSFGDILRSADDFARREPVAFFGTALVAGFAVSRFLGSSARRPAGRSDRFDFEDFDAPTDDRFEGGERDRGGFTRSGVSSGGGTGATMTNEFGRHQDHAATGDLGRGGTGSGGIGASPAQASPAGGSSASMAPSGSGRPGSQRTPVDPARPGSPSGPSNR